MDPNKKNLQTEAFARIKVIGVGGAGQNLSLIHISEPTRPY